MNATGIKIISYNIHKGFSSGNLRFTLKRIKQAIHEIKPDLVCLQEVLGYHDHHKRHFPGQLHFSQPEYLAEGLWPHLTYGKNAVYPKGHHGNAVLSRFPIQHWENQDISKSTLERRGLLHAVLKIPGRLPALHIINTHLGLFESDRNHQIRSLYERVHELVPQDEPLLVTGDFNDWRKNATHVLRAQLGLKEAFMEFTGDHVKTFPSWLPIFSLDRIYYRGMTLSNAKCMNGPPWNSLSDHCAVVCDFHL